MPILAFAAARNPLSGSLDDIRRQTVIEVTQSARERIESVIRESGQCCSPQHVKVLRDLAERREFDVELALLIGAIERDGEVHVRFL